MGVIVAKLTFTQDFFSSSGGRFPYSIAKTAMKVFLGCAVALLIFSLLPFETESAKGDGPKVTHEVEFDITTGGEAKGTIKVGLFGKTVPRTVKNFFQLAEKSKPNGYVDSSFHRVIKISCCKVVTSLTEMEPEEDPSTEKSLLTRTSSSSTMDLDGCPWPTLEKIQTDRNFLSP